MANEAPTATPPVPTLSPPRKKKGRRAYLILFSVAAAAVGAYEVHNYLTRDEVTTDDAQVDADVVPIATRVGGVVLHMKVSDNQRVEAGATIAEIDDLDYKARAAAARADLEAAAASAEAADAQVEIVKSTSAGGLSSAKAQLEGTGASVRSAAAQVDAAAAALARVRSDLAKAESDYDRAKKLHDQGAVSGQALDTATSARDAAKAAVDAAAANLAAARDQRALSESRVAEAQGRVLQSAPVARQIAAAEAAAKLAHAKVHAAEAAIDLADRQVTYTVIKAPVTGTVSKLAVHENQLVQPGTTLMMIVPQQSFVVANFKETQLERIRAGDAVDVTIDALGDHVYHGKVESLSAATGARFSMMPPDNATGNFVKVVQRVPVKITWVEGQDLALAHAGLSAVVKVHLQR